MDSLQMNVPSSGGGGGGHAIEDEGVPVATQATMNFVGAGVTVTDTGGKTQVSIPGGAGSFTVTSVTVDLPYPARRSHRVTVTDAAVTGSSKIMLCLAGVPDTQANGDDASEPLSMSAIPGTGSFLFCANFLTPIAGPLIINYTLG